MSEVAGRDTGSTPRAARVRAPLRPGVQALVDGWRLDRAAPDPALAEAHLRLAEEHLAAAAATEAAGHRGAARSTYVEVVRHALRAMLAMYGLTVVARGRDDPETILTAFGIGELAATPEERRAAEVLAMLHERYDQQQRLAWPVEPLDQLPEVATTAVTAARDRLAG